MSNMIFVVEDDPDITRALTIRLKAAGFEVATAQDAIMAMTVAVEAKPSLAILDISMPGGSGFDVAERLQAEPVTAGIPMIFLTASKRPGLWEKAQELGAVGFFEKPYEADMLINFVSETLKTLSAE